MTSGCYPQAPPRGRWNPEAIPVGDEYETGLLIGPVEGN